MYERITKEQFMRYSNETLHICKLPLICNDLPSGFSTTKSRRKKHKQKYFHNLTVHLKLNNVRKIYSRLVSNF